jgi:hypothetical protein
MSLLKDFICTAAELAEHVIKYEAKSLVTAVEAQVKSAECCFKKMYFWRCLVMLGLILLLTGIGLIITGALILLASVTDAGVAALIIGVIVTLLAAIVIVSIKNSIR